MPPARSQTTPEQTPQQRILEWANGRPWESAPPVEHVTREPWPEGLDAGVVNHILTHTGRQEWGYAFDVVTRHGLFIPWAALCETFGVGHYLEWRRARAEGNATRAIAMVEEAAKREGMGSPHEGERIFKQWCGLVAGPWALGSRAQEQAAKRQASALREWEERRRVGVGEHLARIQKEEREQRQAARLAAAEAAFEAEDPRPNFAP